MSGQLTATRFLDEASHFFDGWNTHTLQDDWNEAYGAYIQQIEDPRNIDILDAMNEELPEIELPAQPRPVTPGPPNGPAPRSFNVCIICNQELDANKWFNVRPCAHSFCRPCCLQMFPPKKPNESEAKHKERCKPCFYCRGEIKSIDQTYPNVLILTEGEYTLPVVHADANEAAAAAAAGAAAALEEEIEDDGAAERRRENQRMLSQLMHTNNHRGPPQPNSAWDQLRDEFDLEEISDASQSQSGSQLGSLPMVGVAARGTSRGTSRGTLRGTSRGTSRGRKVGGRYTRGSRSSRGRDRATVVQELDQVARSILKTHKHRGVGKKSRPSSTAGGSQQETSSTAGGSQQGTSTTAGGSKSVRFNVMDCDEFERDIFSDVD